MTPREWKAFYARERAELGDAGLAALFDRAIDVELPKRGAIVYPHTRLRESGHLVASAARAVVRSGAESVLAVGVLHAARDADAGLVARARAGERDALAALRRVHGPGTDDDAGYWHEEFSLDGFTSLLEVAARLEGKRAPRIVARFPYFVGDSPDDLRGIDELRAIAKDAAIVATTDPLHHGAGYGTPPESRHAIEDVAFARTRIEEGFALLARRAYSEFARHAAATRSDFRDSGPTLAAILEGSFAFHVHAIELVDYTTTLGVPAPTWVAAALATVS
jgi:hypothetical protein